MPAWKYLFKKKYLNPAVSKSHSPYHLSNNRFKQIYIVRDPRDVYISYYHFLSGENDLKHFSWFIANYEFPYGRWSDHVRSWIEHQNKDNIAIVKYEDLVKNKEREFLRILNYLKKINGIYIDKEKLHQSIDETSFEKLSKKEREFGFDEASEHGVFFRKGIIGDWKNNLDKSIVKILEKEFQSEMKELNYI